MPICRVPGIESGFGKVLDKISSNQEMIDALETFRWK